MTEVLAGHEYTVVEGVGSLGKLLSASGESAVYQMETDGTSPQTVIELRRSDSTEADNQLARWHERTELSHPNLLRLHKAGRAIVNDVPVIYVVLEWADESLAEVLSVRPLRTEEASEILRPTLLALDYLHKSGYTQGSLEPSKIRAVGDTLKLSAGDVLRIDEGGNPADDMWDFGLVLVQAITGSAPQLERGFDPAGIPQLVSEPFNGIVRHCLDVNAETRWTAEQALHWLSYSADVDTPAVRQPFVIPEPAVDRATPVNRRWVYASTIVLLLVGGIGWLASK
ncbi:MAG: hypothetical protein M3N54_10350, partial [Acidobacteriota bacterium]|nr:hypothetical protein [Acidobacteriota bacterium]